MAAKIKRNDEIIVLAGKDKGKRGKVKSTFSNDKVLVGGINLFKKHQKPNPQLGVSGGIIEQERPINVSNVAIFNPNSGKADRVGFRIENSKKVRFFKSTNEVIG